MPNRPTVFSTSVEVFLARAKLANDNACLLHVRGGVSPICFLAITTAQSSPRPWRCFQRNRPQDCRAQRVFSTSVEVFLCGQKEEEYAVCLLHVRGGVSYRTSQRIYMDRSSPRPWRCFLYSRGRCSSTKVFSTSVEVFPSSSEKPKN